MKVNLLEVLNDIEVSVKGAEDARDMHDAVLSAIETARSLMAEESEEPKALKPLESIQEGFQDFVASYEDLKLCTFIGKTGTGGVVILQNTGNVQDYINLLAESTQVRLNYVANQQAELDAKAVEEAAIEADADEQEIIDAVIEASIEEELVADPA